jgi:hypothetical protein
LQSNEAAEITFDDWIGKAIETGSESLVVAPKPRIRDATNYSEIVRIRHVGDHDPRKIGRRNENRGLSKDNGTSQAYQEVAATFNRNSTTPQLEPDGQDLRRAPIEERKAALAKLLRRPTGSIAFDEHYSGDGAIIYKHACALGCEGIVSKRLGSPYRSGRANCWLKVKNPAAPAVTREAEEEWGNWKSALPFR